MMTLASRRNPSPFDARLLATIIPPVICGVLFFVFLGHRHDYNRHFLAGYGGTLCAMMVWLKSRPVEHFATSSVVSLIPVTFACVLIGVFTEATAFYLAKFDAIDFCSQSLGAVLAGIVMLSHIGTVRPPDRSFDNGMIVSITFLSLGSVFAIA